MKRIFVLTALLISFSAFTQSFTLNELIKLANSSDDYFDTYVTQKGYIFDKIGDDEYFKQISYTYLVNGLSQYYASKILPKIETHGFVSFQTPNTSTYLKIKEEIRIKGYMLSKKGTYKDSPYFEYRKGNTIVTLHSISEMNEYTNKKRTCYEIAVKTNYVEY
jgi:hypothetical protein